MAKLKGKVLTELENARAHRVALWEYETTRLFGPKVTKALGKKLASIQRGIPLWAEEQVTEEKNPTVQAVLEVLRK